MSESQPIRPVVVVPVHKREPSAMERVSLVRCGEILGSYDILMLAPVDLDLGAYRALMPISGEIRVASEWMESVEAYNRLMLSPVVIEHLDGYSHMLLHEPDALVLRDELAAWCETPYDYIGAVWFEGMAQATYGAAVLGVGNSGFSLHRVEAALAIRRSYKRWYRVKDGLSDVASALRGRRAAWKRLRKCSGSGGTLRGAWKGYEWHCDLFWSLVVPSIESLRIAPVAEALKFSWEVLPRQCMEMTGGHLPFGIHAWAKYDLEWLAPHLEACGVDLAGVQALVSS